MTDEPIRDGRDGPDQCVFCDIIAGTVPSSVVYEDETTIAFMDTGPVNTGHVLVVPKEHAPGLADLDEAAGAHIMRVTMRVADAIRRSEVRCEGINLFLADGEAAFQEIFHVHLHLLPRYDGDPFKIDADWGIHPPRAELDSVAASIRNALSR